MSDEVPAKYRLFYDTLLRCGLSEQRALDAVRKDVKRDLALAARRCPECGKVIAKTVDRRQDGVSAVPGIWFNYRCVSCGYAIDVREPD